MYTRARHVHGRNVQVVSEKLFNREYPYEFCRNMHPSDIVLTLPRAEIS